MKKLLIATDSFLPKWDGIARFLSELIPELSNDYDITILAPGQPGSDNDTRVIRFPYSLIRIGGFNLPMPKMSVIKEHVAKADIVFTNSIGPIGALAMMSARSMDKPLISYVHSIEWELFAKATSKNPLVEHFVRFLTKISMRFLYNKCNLIMVPSFETGEILKREKIKSMKIVIPLGIDIEKFIAPVSKSEAKEKLGIRKDKIVIGFTGRLSREKSILTLHKAFASLKKKIKNIKLLVVGDGLESIKNVLKEDNDIMMPGSVNDVVPYLQAMDIYVLPSLTETSSLSTMEAMACSLPVVVTKVGNLKVYIKDRENGVFFPKENHTVLALKLEWLIEKEYIRRVLGHNARQTITDNYQWKKSVQKIKNVFAGV